MGFAATFPGQGSQAVGMLAGLAEGCPEVRQTFDEASGVLGYDLWRLAQDGPETRLNATEQTQPAMLAAGVSVWRSWLARGGAKPICSAGHSLGEYSALVAAGVVGFERAVALVAARGRFMQEAVPEGQGAIAAVLGLDDAAVIACCDAVMKETPQLHVSAVNFNAPGQVAVAGHAAAVERLLERAKAEGARRAIRLPMSVPVHCALMCPATPRLSEMLESTPFEPAAFMVIHNADLSECGAAADVCRALAAQLHSPVRWVDTMATIARTEPDCIVEMGPGGVLTGLLRRIDRQARGFAIHDVESLETALGAVAEAQE